MAAAWQCFNNVDALSGTDSGPELPHSDMLPAGQHNDLATAMLSSPVDTVKRIFSLGHEQSADVCAGHSPCYFTLRSLAVLFPTFLILMALTGGLAVPGGLFVPSILVKSCSALHLTRPCPLPGSHALLAILVSPRLCSVFGHPHAQA